jgi:hypothetical protein
VPNTHRACAFDLADFGAWGGHVPSRADEIARDLAHWAASLRPSTLQRRLAEAVVRKSADSVRRAWLDSFRLGLEISDWMNNRTKPQRPCVCRLPPWRPFSLRTAGYSPVENGDTGL